MSIYSVSRFVFVLFLAICSLGLAAQDVEPLNSTNVSLGEGLNWETEDGAFRMGVTTHVQFQMLYSAESGSGTRTPTSGPDIGIGGTGGRDFWAFRFPTATTEFKGHIFSKSFRYQVRLNWTRSSVIDIAKFTWAGAPLYNVSVGQDKTPFNWQEMLDRDKQMMANRSVYNEAFNEDYAKGLWVQGKFVDADATWVKYWVGVYNGLLLSDTDNRNADRGTLGDAFKDNSTSNSSGGIDADLMLNFRVETYPLGEFAQEGRDARDDNTAPLFMVGLAANWFASDSGNEDMRPDNTSGFNLQSASGRFQGQQRTLAVTLDAHLRWFGINVDLEVAFRKTEFFNSGSLKTFRNVGGASVPTDLTDAGILIEVGYMLSPEMQAGIRFGAVDADEFTMGGTTGGSGGTNGQAYTHDSTETSAVFNYYMHGQNLRFTFEITYIDFQLASSIGSGSGIAGGNPVSPTGVNFTRSAQSRSSGVSDHSQIFQAIFQAQWKF